MVNLKEVLKKLKSVAIQKHTFS